MITTNNAKKKLRVQGMQYLVWICDGVTFKHSVAAGPVGQSSADCVHSTGAGLQNYKSHQTLKAPQNN